MVDDPFIERALANAQGFRDEERALRADQRSEQSEQDWEEIHGHRLDVQQRRKARERYADSVSAKHPLRPMSFRDRS